MTSFFNTTLVGELELPVDPIAIIVIVHGLGEHRARYRDIIEFFKQRRIGCCSFDHRGHGESATRRGDLRGHIQSFDDLVSDAASIIDGIRFKYPELPLFVWGHSMGAVVATLVAAERAQKIRGVITSSAPFAAFDKVSKWTTNMLTWVARVVPKRVMMLPVDPNRLSRDLEVGRRYLSDPLVPKAVTLRLLTELSAATAKCLRVAPRLQMPWLALHGGSDRVAPPIGSQRLLDALGSTDKQLLLWPEARHEVHNELDPDRTEFLTRIADWVSEHRSTR